MSLVNTETGEIVEVSREEQTAVARLTTAITALSEAVDFMPISEVVSIKAQVATIQTATKELGMSKEAQELAAEAVRRAEWALRRAQKKAQSEGEMRTAQSNLIPGGPRNGGSTTTSETPRPRDMFTSEPEYRDALAMGELDADEFDEVINEAKAEGNLSRANVARKAREQSGQMRGTPRPAAEKSMNLVAIYASKAARAANELTPEQIRRIRPEADAWTVDLRNSIEALQRLVNSLDNKETK